MWSYPSADARSPRSDPGPGTSAPSLVGESTLPAWESFPLPDRHLLIRLIVQTARRQAQSAPTDHPGGQG